jgi:putative hemolysin
MSHHGWGGGDTTLLITVIVLLVCSGFFALAETALVRMTRTRAEALKEERKRGATTLAKLVQSPDNFLNPLLLLILVCQLVSATLVGVLAERLFGTSGLIISTVFEVVVIFVLFEAIPKNFAVVHPNRSALISAPVVSALLRFWPIKWVSTVLLSAARLALRPFGGGESDSVVTEREILAVTSVAQADQQIQPEEARFISKVLELDDTVAREVMTPRTDMIDVSATTTVAEALVTAITSGRSRLPVLGADVDDILGYVTLRHLADRFREGHDDELLRDTGLKEPAFVPETKKIRALLAELKAGRQHLAIVVDEYGGTAGIVTLEDILEEVVGQILDEDDKEEALDPAAPGEGPHDGQPKWPKLLSGRLNIDDANEQYNLDLPEGEWDTVGGLVLNQAGGVPDEGDAFEIGPYLVTVRDVDGRRIEAVSVAMKDES